MVNFLWKFLGRMGTSIFYKREPKISLYLFGSMYQTMIDTVAEIRGGNYEQAMDELIELVKPLSLEILTSLLFETSVWGVELKSLISKYKDLEDFDKLVDLTLFSVFGRSWSKKIFEKTKYIPASLSEQKVETYILRLKSCPFCYPSQLPAEQLGSHRFGKFFAITIEQMVQIIQDFFENDYHVVTRETACFHVGDSYGEIRIWLYPRDNLQLMESNPYLKQIK